MGLNKHHHSPLREEMRRPPVPVQIFLRPKDAPGSTRKQTELLCHALPINTPVSLLLFAGLSPSDSEQRLVNPADQCGLLSERNFSPVIVPEFGKMGSHSHMYLL